MSEHTNTEHGHEEGEHAHSHKKLYLQVGGFLTVLTIIELVILPDVIDLGLGETILNWILVVLSVVKLAFVVGIFMHLKDDRKIYSIMFVPPMIMAAIMIIVLVAMVAFHAEPFKQQTNTPTARQILEDPSLAPWAPQEESFYQEQYAVAEKSAFKAGKEVYDINCAACHRADGGGQVGPALTDDCYIHGGDLNQIVSLIHKGSAAKGMPSWEGSLSDDQIDQVSYYVRSLRGKKVENPKACEGERVK